VNYEEGQKTLSSRQWKRHEGFFRKVLEIGRRYKGKEEN
jgi:hypothetical protein